jgi:lysyl endopeptidase
MGDVFSLEGVAFFAYAGSIDGARPVYRFYAPRTGSHFFTISEAEKDWIVANLPPTQMSLDGVAWWAFP